MFNTAEIFVKPAPVNAVNNKLASPVAPAAVNEMLTAELIVALPTLLSLIVNVLAPAVNVLELIAFDLIAVEPTPERM